jgi:hypothetical protein
MSGHSHVLCGESRSFSPSHTSISGNRR